MLWVFQIKKAGTEGLALMGDTYHMNIEETDSSAALKRNIQKLEHMHFADNTRLEPGSGSIDFSRILKTLDALEYENYISFEFMFSAENKDRKTTIAKAISHLRNCVS